MDILKQTVEWQNWGWNLTSLSFIATMFFSALQAWALGKQNTRIATGAAVSVVAYGYFGAYFLAFFPYAIAIRSIAIAANGMLAGFYLAGLVKLWRGKGFTTTEKRLLSLFVAIPIVMGVTQRKDLFLLLLLAGILCSTAREVWELWSAGTAGDLEPRRIAVFMATGVFWFAYAVGIQNLPFMIFHPMFFLILTAQLVLWAKFRKRAHAPEP